MVLISRTFSEVTPESAEDGETSDAGYIAEDLPHTFRELVAALRSHANPSTSHVTGDALEWFSSDSEPDYVTGAERTESVHYSHANPARSLKYWRAAVRHVHGRSASPGRI